MNTEQETLNSATCDAERGLDVLDPNLLWGRQLDAVVAEKVFGWEVTWAGGVPCRRWYPDDGRTGRWTDILPSYSIDIAAAMQVVDKLTEGHMVTLVHIAKLNVAKTWIVSLSTNGPGFIRREGEAETLPLAICRAALLACSE